MSRSALTSSPRQLSVPLTANVVANVIRNVWSTPGDLLRPFPGWRSHKTDMIGEPGQWYLADAGRANFNAEPALRFMSNVPPNRASHSIRTCRTFLHEVSVRVRGVCTTNTAHRHTTGSFLVRWQDLAAASYALPDKCHVTT